MSAQLTTTLWARATSEPTSDDGASTEALAGGIPGVRGRAGRVSFLTHMGISLTVPAIARCSRTGPAARPI